MENEKRIKCEDLFQLADKDIKDGYIEQAHKTLEDILKMDPTFGKAHNHLGWLYETKYQDYPKAEEHYKKALELTPNYFSVYYNYAILLSTLNRYDDLNKLLDKALQVPGINKATIYNEYGIMFEQLEEYDLAIKNYQNAAKLTLDNAALDRYMNSIERCKKKLTL
ncbi:MAG: hypothetical protein Kow0079_05990 [Vicingaceae bacterium]